jgi:PAS domain S-box-containing protein
MNNNKDNDNSKHINLLKGFPEAVILTNASGVISSVSEEALSLLGYETTKELLGKHAYDFVAPFDRERIKENTEKAKKEKIVRQVEYVIQRKDGTFFVGEMNTGAVREKGDLAGFMVSIRDITDFKIEHQVLVDRELQLRVAQGLANLGSFRYDVTTGEFSWSAELFGLLQLEEESGPFSPQVYLEHVHPEERDSVEASWEVLITEGIRMDMYYRLLLPSGKVLHVHGVGQAVKNRKEEVVRVFGVVHDITQMKERETRLERLLKENKMLMGELKHRTKNSLSLMSSLISLELDKLQDNQCQELLREIEAKITTIADVFNKLNLDNDSQDIQLSEYLADIVDSFRDVYSGLIEKIDFQFDFQDVSLDAKRATALGLIETELLTNALKYAFPPEWKEKRQNTISISLRKRGEGKTVEFSFWDNGIPMKEDFSPGESTGSGMTILLALTAELDGRLAFEKRKNKKGFIVTFPASAHGENNQP